MQIHSEDDYRSKGYVASSVEGYAALGASRGTLLGMRSTPAIDDALRLRLEQAVKDFAGGSADKFGRMLGYTNGGYIRECLGKKRKPVREALIYRVNASEYVELHGLFNDLLPAVALADLESKTEPPKIKQVTGWLRLLTVAELDQTVEYIKNLAFKGKEPEVIDDGSAAYTEAAATVIPAKKTAKRSKKQPSEPTPQPHQRP